MMKTKRKKTEVFRSSPDRHTGDSQEATSSVNFDESQVKQEPPESSSSPGPTASTTEEDEVPDTASSDPRQVVICPLCSTCLPNIAQFVTHMTVAHGGATFGSSPLFDLPANRLLGASSLPSYLANPFLMGQNLCLLCGGLVTSLDSAMLHLMNHYIQSKTVHTCAQCNVQCHSADELARHNYNKHSLEVFKCAICGEILNSKEEREKHFRKRHLNEKQVGVCVFCPQEQLLDAKEAYRHLYTKHLMSYYDKYNDRGPSTEGATEREVLQEISESSKQQTTQPHSTQSSLKSLDMSPSSKSPVWSVPTVSPPAIPCHAVSKLLNLFKEESTRRCSMCHQVFEDEMSVLRHQMQAHRTEDGAGEESAEAVAGKSSALNSVVSGTSVSGPGVVAGTSTGGLSGGVSGTSSGSPNGPISSSILSPWHTQYKCSYCDECFKRPVELERHIRVHYTSLDAKCNICDEVFPSVKVLQQHKKQQHQRLLPDAEGAVTSSASNGTGADSAAASILGTSSTLLQQYQVMAARLLNETPLDKEPLEMFGAKMVAGERKRSSACPVCDASFDSAFLLDIHMIGHKDAERTGSSTAQDLGGERLVRDSPIFRVSSSKPNNDGKYVCQICDRNFPDESAMMNHREEHLTSLVKKAIPNSAEKMDTSVSEDLEMKHRELSTSFSETAVDDSDATDVGMKSFVAGHHYKCFRCKRIFKSWKEHFIHRKSKKCRIKL